MRFIKDQLNRFHIKIYTLPYVTESRTSIPLDFAFQRYMTERSILSLKDVKRTKQTRV